jgi:cell division protease FtsH
MPKIKIEQITITPRSDTLGFVSFDSEDNYSNMSKNDLENKIITSYAGRIAQMKQFAEDGFDSGASNDLKQATRYAYDMVAKLGMCEDIGYINIDGIPKIENKQGIIADITSNFMKDKIEAQVIKILKNQKQRAEKLVEDNWSLIEKLAKKLLKQEVVHEQELNEILKDK